MTDQRERAIQALRYIFEQRDTDWAMDPGDMDQRFVANHYASKLERIFARAQAAIEVDREAERALPQSDEEGWPRGVAEGLVVAAREVSDAIDTDGFVPGRPILNAALTRLRQELFKMSREGEGT